MRHLDERQIAELRIDEGRALIVRENLGVPRFEERQVELQHDIADVREALRTEFSKGEVLSLAVTLVVMMVVGFALPMTLRTYTVGFAQSSSASQLSLGETLGKMAMSQTLAYLMESVVDWGDRRWGNGNLNPHLFMSACQIYMVFLASAIKLFSSNEGQHTSVDVFLTLGLLAFLVNECRRHYRQFQI